MRYVAFSIPRYLRPLAKIPAFTAPRFANLPEDPRGIFATGLLVGTRRSVVCSCVNLFRSRTTREGLIRGPMDPQACKCVFVAHAPRLKNTEAECVSFG